MRLTIDGIDPFVELEFTRGTLQIVWVRKAPWEFRRLESFDGETWAWAVGAFDLGWTPKP